MPEAQYARENWYGSDSTAQPTTADSGDSDDRPTYDELLDRDQPGADGVVWAEWLAHRMLKDVSALLCPECGRWATDAHDPHKVPVLSEPRFHVPESIVEREDGTTIRYHSTLRRSRVCEDCGHLGGGPVGDLPTEDFLAVVRAVLDANDVPPGQYDDLLGDARRRKQRGWADVDTLERLLTDLRYGREDK